MDVASFRPSPPNAGSPRTTSADAPAGQALQWLRSPCPLGFAALRPALCPSSSSFSPHPNCLIDQELLTVSHQMNIGSQRVPGLLGHHEIAAVADQVSVAGYDMLRLYH